MLITIIVYFCLQNQFPSTRTAFYLFSWYCVRGQLCVFLCGRINISWNVWEAVKDNFSARHNPFNNFDPFSLHPLSATTACFSALTVLKSRKSNYNFSLFRVIEFGWIVIENSRSHDRNDLDQRKRRWRRFWFLPNVVRLWNEVTLKVIQW
jgi:hypothetical protein